MASFGEELKRERELRDISLKEISEATKISIRFLEALEQNNFDILPGGIFNRGFIRAYARFIGIDGEEMVNAYLHEVALKEARQTQRVGQGFPPRPAATRASAPAEPRAEVRPERRSAPRPSPSGLAGLEGRTSLLLWVMAAIAFIIGAVVIVMSLMGGERVSAGAGHPAVTSEPASSTSPSVRPPSRPLVAGLGEKQEPATGPETIAPPAHAAGGTDTAAGAESGAESGGASRTETAAMQTPPEPEPEPSTPPADTPAAAQSEAAAGDDNTPAEPEVPRHRVRVLATETTVVSIRCGDRVVLDQELWPGQTRTFTCEEPVMLGASNGGGVQYSLDGAPPALLGGLGERVEGLVVAPPPQPAEPAGPEGPRAGD